MLSLGWIPRWIFALLATGVVLSAAAQLLLAQLDGNRTTYASVVDQHCADPGDLETDDVDLLPPVAPVATVPRVAFAPPARHAARVVAVPRSLPQRSPEPPPPRG